MSDVSFVKINDRNPKNGKEVIFNAVKKAMRLANWQDHIKGKNIAIKPNLVSDNLVPGQNTSPWVLEAVVDELTSNLDANFTIIEADTNTSNVDNTIILWKTKNILEKYDIPFVNLSNDIQIEYNLNGLMHKKMLLPQSLLKFDAFVNIPVMKTHGMSTITGGLKNWWGFINERHRHNFHQIFSDTIRDMHMNFPPKGFRPCFTILDGTICMEGGAPRTGIPRIENVIMASSDIVALDSMEARYMHIDPEDVDYIKKAYEAKIGNMKKDEIKIIGDEFNPSDTPFVRAEGRCIVIKVEMPIRIFLNKNSKFLYYILFESPLFKLLALTSWTANLTWLFKHGNKYREDIVCNHWLGEQYKFNNNKLPIKLSIPRFWR